MGFGSCGEGSGAGGAGAPGPHDALIGAAVETRAAEDRLVVAPWVVEAAERWTVGGGGAAGGGGTGAVTGEVGAREFALVLLENQIVGVLDASIACSAPLNLA